MEVKYFTWLTEKDYSTNLSGINFHFHLFPNVLLFPPKFWDVMTNNFARSLLLSIKEKSWKIVKHLWAIGKILLSFYLWISFHDNITRNFQEKSLVISGAFYSENSKGNIVLHAFVSASIYEYKVKCSSLFVSLCWWMYL